MSEPLTRPIPKHWLDHRLDPDDPRDAWVMKDVGGPETELWMPSAMASVMSEFEPLIREGDEFWLYDEPAPPGILAGEIGIALVRVGEPIHGIMIAVH